MGLSTQGNKFSPSRHDMYTNQLGADDSLQWVVHRSMVAAALVMVAIVHCTDNASMPFLKVSSTYRHSHSYGFSKDPDDYIVSKAQPSSVRIHTLPHRIRDLSEM